MAIFKSAKEFRDQWQSNLKGKDGIINKKAKQFSTNLIKDLRKDIDDYHENKYELKIKEKHISTWAKQISIKPDPLQKDIALTQEFKTGKRRVWTKWQAWLEEVKKIQDAAARKYKLK